MAWLQIKLTTDRNEALRVSDVLSDAGAVAVTLQDAADEPHYEPAPGEAPLWASTQVVGLFPDDVNAEELLATLRAKLGAPAVESSAIEPLADADWERVWMDRFQPLRFGARLWVCPSWHAPPQPDAVNILLDPGMAFGTGTHPTTALCLEWLDQADVLDKVVIDYGCGSGVLAIAAAKLGADHVFAVDHDLQALRTTAENARRNDVADRIMTLPPDQLPTVPCDILLANILAAPLKALARVFARLLKPTGQLVMSGILPDQVDDLRASYAPWFEITRIDDRDGWVRVVGTRNAGAEPDPGGDGDDDESRIDTAAIAHAGRQAVTAEFTPAPAASGAARTTLWSGAALLALAALVLQYAYFYRDQLYRYDLLQPWLVRLCDIAPCGAPLRFDAGRIRVAAREVTSHPSAAGGLLVNATIVNDSDKPQRFPLVQLSLSDFNGELLALRRFHPEDYLDASVDYRHGMSPGASVQVLLELSDPGVDVVGFAFEFL